MNITLTDPLHPLYKGILSRAAALGYVRPNFRGQLLQNEFLVDLIENNIWDELDCLLVVAMKTGGGNGGNFAMINWKNPTGTLATLEASGSLTFNDETGINGNGAGGYVDTKFNPVTNGVNYTANLNSVLNSNLEHHTEQVVRSLIRATLTQGYDLPLLRCSVRIALTVVRLVELLLLQIIKPPYGI